MANPLLNTNTNNPYGISTNRTEYEGQAGVDAPKYASFLDAEGQLKAPYKNDPNQSAAFKKMSDIAQSSDLSPWAQLQMSQNDLSTQKQRDMSNAQGMGANTQAMNQLMATGGGANSGASAFLASQGARNQMMSNQNIGSAAQQNALGIQLADAQNKQTMLGQVANTETGAQSANAQAAMGDTTAANLFNTNRYHEQLAAWGAATTADGQVAAANNTPSGKK